jgi:hypothetical protein
VNYWRRKMCVQYAEDLYPVWKGVRKLNAYQLQFPLEFREWPSRHRGQTVTVLSLVRPEPSSLHGQYLFFSVHLHFRREANLKPSIPLSVFPQGKEYSM